MSLRTAIEKADAIISNVNVEPENFLEQQPEVKKWKSIHCKLTELYIKESRRRPHNKNLLCQTKLLEKLVKKENLSTLIVNLYPDNEGYSLMFRTASGTEIETIKLPYEESELLEYIDAEELPPILVDIAERSPVNLFHSGCVIVELRDYRRSSDKTYDTNYVFLRPTNHTLICDINGMTSDSEYRWTQEDLYSLESQLLLRTNEPLCLDPSPAVYAAANSLQFDRYRLHSRHLKRSVKRHSQIALNRRRKLAQCSAPKHLFLHDFVSKKKAKFQSTPEFNLKVGKPTVDMWKQRDVELENPSSIEVEKNAKLIDSPIITHDCTPVVVEEYILETERSQGKVYYTKLSIKQQLNDDLYIGELYVDRDYSEGSLRGSTCKFLLGTRGNVNKYIKQFTEIFTEEGRRSVKITHQVPGQAPVVNFTQAISSAPPTNTAAGPLPQQNRSQMQQQQLLQQQTLLTQKSPSAAKEVQPPLKLSLQISPSTSAGNFSGQTQIAVSQGQVALGQGQIPLGQGQVPIGQGQIAMSLNLQQQQQLAQHLARQASAQQGQRNVNFTKSTQSSVTAASSTQLPSYTQATGISITSSQVTFNIQTPQISVNNQRPSFNITSVCSTVPSSIVSPTSVPLPTTSPVSAPGTPPVSTPTPAPQPAPSPNINITNNVNITNLASLPPNINIQNFGPAGQLNGQLGAAAAQFGGVNLAAQLQQLQGIGNVHVTLTGAPGNQPGVAVPIPLGVINQGVPPVNQSATPVSAAQATPISAQQPISVGFQTNAAATAASGLSAQSPTVGSPPAMTSVMGVGSMVTGVPPAVSAAPSSGAPSSGSAPTGMISLPIGVTHFMTTNLKGAPNIRPGTPLSLVQIPGQQSLQLFSGNFSPQQTRVTLTQPLAPVSSITSSVPSDSTKPSMAPGSQNLVPGSQQQIIITPQAQLQPISVQPTQPSTSPKAKAAPVAKGRSKKRQSKG